jgi:hypothetical protein
MKISLFLLTFLLFFSCGEKEETTPPVVVERFELKAVSINGAVVSGTPNNVNTRPIIRISFSAPVNRSTTGGILLNADGGTAVNYTVSFENNDSTVVVQPSSGLTSITKYSLVISSAITSKNNKSLPSSTTITFITAIDPSDKFPRIPDNELLDLVQRQTFKYFWDFAHPVSGLARERNTSGDIVTSGGSGFGVMAIVTGIHRNFITRAEGRARIQKMVSFLKNTAQRFQGAYPHWLNGSTGAVIPFSTKDNGADLVETSYLIQGLLTARQYFNGADAEETQLRNDINTIWREVEWSKFRKNNENVLYWHWSPNYFWDMNLQIRGWNECLITYVLAASSTTNPIPKIVYDNGWAQNGAIRNNSSYFGIQLPLGPPYGGPLFFAHYSFLGLNPNNLTDAYANYWDQNRNHARINHAYCRENPRGHYGYSDSCWGLTASDDHLVGYMAHEPMNDNGVIAPTAALSSFPYTPTESMQALKYFYYKLGDRLWKEYGFVDAFSLKDAWFANSFLAIDQGPIIVMMENYRSGLLWDLFMSCPEVKQGLRSLGFQSPYL